MSAETLMVQRDVAITNDAEHFLHSYEARLIREGSSGEFVNEVARDLYDVVFVRLPGEAFAIALSTWAAIHISRDTHATVSLTELCAERTRAVQS